MSERPEHSKWPSIRTARIHAAERAVIEQARKWARLDAEEQAGIALLDGVRELESAMGGKSA